MKIRQQNLKVVVIGGGTGLSTMLKGIKKYTSHITAIVTVSDNGGGSGKLRQEMGIIPPGDIRNCLVALANTEPIMEKLLQHRFKEGGLCGQSFGNLFLAALTEITGSFEEAVKVTSNVLAITGKVLPVTYEDVHLEAIFENGKKVVGETQIVEYGKENLLDIKEIHLKPKAPQPAEEVMTAIEEADLIVFGPGSLYTSIISNLLVEKVTEQIAKSKADKIYVANVMTQPGETTNLSLEDHVTVLENYVGKGIINLVIANNASIPEEYLKQYKEDGAKVLKVNEEHEVWKRTLRIEAPLVSINEKKGLVRHDSMKLAQCIFESALTKIT